jgi:hypothetical protein
VIVRALLNPPAGLFLGLRSLKAKADFDGRRTVAVMQPKSGIPGVCGQKENPDRGVRAVRFAEPAAASIGMGERKVAQPVAI